MVSNKDKWATNQFTADGSSHIELKLYMLDLLERSSFLNRISSLQRLCSENDKNFPKALLFIPGQDGRNNKGSVTILKYLMRGSVSKDLTDETLDPAFEPLEELVLLIRQTSVSVIWRYNYSRLILNKLN